MLKHNIKFLLRNFIRNTNYSLIIIIGLSIGITCGTLIYLWIDEELKVNRFHANNDQLYTVYKQLVTNNEVSANYEQPLLLARTLKENVPEIKHASSFARYLSVSNQTDNKESFRVGSQIEKFSGNRADPDFFKMFSYPLIEGSKDHALAKPGSIAISRKMAEILFGRAENVVGNTINYENQTDLVVTAVFENVSPLSEDQFDYITLIEDWLQTNTVVTDWTYYGVLTYIQVEPGTNVDALEEKIQYFLNDYIDQDETYKLALGLQPFGDTYLYSNFEAGHPAPSRIKYVRTLTWLALFILLVACINFVNLATARSIKRVKEVSIRKVVGAGRGTLMRQFLLEALFYSLVAGLISIAFLEILLPLFNAFVDKTLFLPYGAIKFWLFYLGLLLGIGLVAGIYPAMILSAFKMPQFIKGIPKKKGSIGVRRALVVFQFAISIFFIASFFIVAGQLDYLFSKDLGFDRENLLYQKIEGSLVQDYLVYKQEALRINGVKAIDRIAQPPHAMNFKKPVVFWEGKDPNSVIPFTPASVGYDFVGLMDLSILKGRDFSKSYSNDVNNFIVNETAANIIDADNPIGKELSIWGKRGQIVGVIEDYQFTSAHTAISPLILDIKEGLDFGTVLIKTEKGQTKNVIEGLKKLHAKLNSNIPFSITFADHEYQKLYQSEQFIAKLNSVLGVIAILISCLGVLGLITFTARQKSKEISIRKVLGASVLSIMTLLTKDYLRLILIAFLIAVPLCWFALNEWLESFAYRISIQWWVFLLAGLLTVVIALLSVSAQSIKAATAQPSKNLRSE